MFCLLGHCSLVRNSFQDINLCKTQVLKKQDDCVCCDSCLFRYSEVLKFLMVFMNILCAFPYYNNIERYWTLNASSLNLLRGAY